MSIGGKPFQRAEETKDLRGASVRFARSREKKNSAKRWTRGKSRSEEKGNTLNKLLGKVCSEEMKRKDWRGAWWTGIRSEGECQIARNDVQRNLSIHRGSREKDGGSYNN